MKLGGVKTEGTQKRPKAALDAGEGFVDREMFAQMRLSLEPDILRGILLWGIGRK